MEGYGRDLGVAFQIADDVLDIWGEESTTGKSLGTDLEKQKLTLPLIRLLATAPPATASAVRRLLAEANPENRHELRPYLEDSGALDYAWDRARQYAGQAAAALDVLPDSPARIDPPQPRRLRRPPVVLTAGRPTPIPSLAPTTAGHRRLSPVRRQAPTCDVARHRPDRCFPAEPGGSTLAGSPVRARISRADPGRPGTEFP